MARARARTTCPRLDLLVSDFPSTSGTLFSNAGMTDNDRQHHDFNPINIGDSVKSADQYLTRKTVYDTLATQFQFN